MYTTSNHDMYINDVSFIVYIAISMVYTLMCSTTWNDDPPVEAWTLGS
jgi:hypothetical protein